MAGGPAGRTVSAPAALSSVEPLQSPITGGESAPRPRIPSGETSSQQVLPVRPALPRDGMSTFVPPSAPATIPTKPVTSEVPPAPGASFSPDANAHSPTPNAPGRDQKPDSVPTAVAPVPSPVPAAAAVARPAEAGLHLSPAAEPEMSELVTSHSAEATPRAAAGRSDVAAPAMTPDLARGIAVQIAETVHRAGTRSVDVTLQPEELGRVRISMSSEQGALAVTLQADRPETLDLIRRNIDLFAEELRRLGHGSVGFSFQHGSPGGGGAQPGAATVPPGDDPTAVPADAAPEAAMPPEPIPLAPRAGIDIRI